MVGRSFAAVAAIATLTAVSLPTAHAQTVRGGQEVTALASHVKSTSAGTLHLKGSLSSTVDMTMTGAFSVGQAHNLSWDLPAVVTTQVNGYTQQINAVSYTFSINPDSQQDLVVNGAPIHRVTWNNPPANTTITVTEHVNTTITSALDKFSSTAAFPLTSLSGDATNWLAATPATTLPAAALAEVKSLAAGKTTEKTVVTAVMNYVASTMSYSFTDHNSATDAFTNHTGTCEAYANLAIAMLHELGIPAQAAFGWVSAQPITLTGKHGTDTIQWSRPGTSGELHVWMNVYFPGTGWVSFDPQMEKFFVDPRHITYLVAKDASNLSAGSFSATVTGNASPTGANLSDGSFEEVPGVSGTVTLGTTDAFTVSLGSMTSDVHNTVLFSR
jgi:hypothetical protein